jgi:hypothetical protein
MQEEINNNSKNKKGWKRHFAGKNIIINGLIAVMPASLIVGILKELGFGGAIVICGIIFGLMYLIGEIREKITEIFTKRRNSNKQRMDKIAKAFVQNLNRNVLKEQHNKEVQKLNELSRKNPERVIKWLEDSEQIPKE